MKKFLLYSFSWLLFTGMLSLHAQEIPTGYYDKAIGKSGKALQEALSTILNNGAKEKSVMSEYMSHTFPFRLSEVR